MRWVATGVFFVCIFLATPTVRADTYKYAVVVGNNVGQESAKALRYAQSDAHKLFDVLIDNGGFDPKHSALLLGKDAPSVWKQVRTVEKQIQRDKRKGHSIVFLFYFSGHAEGDTLQMGKTEMGFERVRDFLEYSAAEDRKSVV